jgi:predicted TIM-barrel fold metal-dependent hydrolase
MIVDCHTHYVGRAYAHLGGGASILDSMDQYGIDHSVIFTLDGFFEDSRRHNDELAQFVAAHPGRLTGFATVYPRRADAADELRRAVTELGMKGLKLHPWLQGISPLEEYMTPVAAACAELEVPIIFHDGTPAYSTPLQMALLAERHPDLVVILGHSGLLDLWPEAIAAATRNPNVWLCLCGPPTSALQRIVDSVPHDRILFGSDTGFGHDYQARHRLEQVRALDLAEESLAAILGGNARRLLSLA